MLPSDNLNIKEWLKEKRHTRNPWGEKLDSNGYSLPLFNTTEGECFICGRHCDTARHEIFYGTADRKTSKAVGLWVNLCPKHHAEVHSNSTELHTMGQKMFEYHYSHEMFMELFGKNYL